MPLRDLRLVDIPSKVLVIRRKGSDSPHSGAASCCSLPYYLPPAEPAFVNLTFYFLRPLSGFFPTVRWAVLQDGGRKHGHEHGYRHVHGRKGHHDHCLLDRAAHYVKGLSHRIGHVLGFLRPLQGAHVPHKKDGFQHSHSHAEHNVQVLPIAVADTAAQAHVQ